VSPTDYDHATCDAYTHSHILLIDQISDPHVAIVVPFLSANPSSLVSTGPGAPVMSTVCPLSLPSVSNHLGPDGIHTTTSEVGQWSGGARQRKRETSLSRVQQSPFGSSAARSMPTLHEQYYGRPWKSRRNNPISSDGGGYMSDSPPAAYHRSQSVEQRREQTHSGSFLDRPGYEQANPRCPQYTRVPGRRAGVLPIVR
jgi:hypothetical protein